MKRKTNVLLGILLMSSIALVSCKKEEVIEENTPTTVTDSRDKFLGTYQMSDTGANGGGSFTTSYTIFITKGNLGGDTISVNNFAETGVANLGVVTGNSLFVFQNPTHLISGTATLNGNTLKFSYTPFEGNRRGTGIK